MFWGNSNVFGDSNVLRDSNVLKISQTPRLYLTGNCYCVVVEDVILGGLRFSTCHMWKLQMRQVKKVITRLLTHDGLTRPLMLN